MLAVAAAAILVYLPSLHNGFLHWDDGAYVCGNRHIRDLSWSVVRWAFTAFHSANWHPLTWLSDALDVQLYGLRPAGHHLTSVLLHAANSALLLWVVRRLTGRLWASAVVAVVFALHPLRVEVVSWVSERKELLCTLFVLLAVLAYARYVARPSVRRYLLVAGAFAAALMSKPMAVTLPLLLLLLDVWPWRRLGWRAVLEKLPLLAMSGAAGAATVLAQADAKASLAFAGYGSRAANALVSCAAYLGKLLWPAPGTLLPFYTHPRDLPGGLPAAHVLLAAAVLVAVTLIAIGQRRRRPYLLVGWLWFLVSVLPVVGLVQVGSQAMADRYTYLPLIGPVLALALLASEVVGRLSSRWVPAAAAAALVALMAWLTVEQQAVWADDASLWEHTVAGQPQSPIARRRLGDTYARDSRLADAVAEYRASVKLKPDYAEGHAALGVTLAKLGMADEAIRHCRRALSLVPNNAVLLKQFGLAVSSLRSRGGDNAEWLDQFASALLALKRYDDAVAAYDEALKVNPEDLVAMNGRGQALARMGQLTEAARSFRSALGIDPHNQEALSNLGVALTLDGRPGEAVPLLRQAVEADPDDAAGHCNLANALMQSTETLDEAVAHFSRAAALDPAMVEAFAGWARAEVARGRPEAAVAPLEAVVQLRPRSGPARAELARVLTALGRDEEAQEHLDRAKELGFSPPSSGQ